MNDQRTFHHWQETVVLTVETTILNSVIGNYSQFIRNYWMGMTPVSKGNERIWTAASMKLLGRNKGKTKKFLSQLKITPFTLALILFSKSVIMEKSLECSTTSFQSKILNPNKAQITSFSLLIAFKEFLEK